MVNFNEEQKIIIDLAEETPITTEVNDINHIPSYKIAEEERRANEQQRIANENEREKFYNEFQDKVNRGDFDADNGVYVGSEPPTDEDVTVWIDPNGTPEVEAKNIFFADNENLQTKYENGELKGEKGDKGEDGTMSFSDLTEEQKASLKGDKGDTGETGADGKDGVDGKDGYTPIKGVDYFTPEDIASLNIPTKLSQLTNDSGFLTSEKQVYSTEEQVIGAWVDGKPIYRKCYIHQFNGTYDDTNASGQMISFVRNVVGSLVDTVVRLEARATNPQFDRIGYLGNSFTSQFGSIEYRTYAGSSGGDMLQIGLLKKNPLYADTIEVNNSVIKIIFEYTKASD